MSTLFIPPPLAKALAEEHGFVNGDVLKIHTDFNTGKPEFPNPSDFVFGEEIVIPDHGYDLHDANILCTVVNAEVVRYATIMGGPTLTVYRKEDPNSPAYFGWVLFEGEGVVLTWMEVA